MTTRRRATYVAERCSATPEPSPSAIRGPSDVAQLFRDSIPSPEVEHFVAFSLNSRNVPTSTRIVSIGTLNASLVHPRDVFVWAVRERAASIIIAHNHPSGDPTPSEEDLAITRRLTEAGKILGIELLDHVIVTPHAWVSLKERRLVR
jgi:DNA repair protein RadC